MRDKHNKTFLTIFLLLFLSLSFVVVGRMLIGQSEYDSSDLKNTDMQNRISQLNDQTIEISHLYDKEVEWSELLFEKSSHGFLLGLSSDCILWKYKGKLFIGFDILNVKKVDISSKKVVFQSSRAKIMPNTIQITSREPLILNDGVFSDGSEIKQYEREEKVEKSIEDRVNEATKIFYDSELSLVYKLNTLVRKTFDSDWEAVIEWIN